tara:strand:- start:91 stop:240 length:150 start_codon:yes stop_codon:yes gene_type:complete
LPTKVKGLKNSAGERLAFSLMNSVRAVLAKTPHAGEYLAANHYLRFFSI